MSVVRIEFALSALPDDLVAGAFAYISRFTDAAPALSLVLRQALMLEAQRRDRNRNSGPQVEAGDAFEFNCDAFSDRDVGDALLACTCITYATEHPQFGEFMDAVTQALTALAVLRLRTSGDVRNAVSFNARLADASRN